MQRKQRKNNQKSKTSQKLVKTKNKSDPIQIHNSVLIVTNGKQPQRGTNTSMIKFVDVSSTASPPSTGIVLSGFCNIPQGIAASQRTGDTVFYSKLLINYIVYCVNSDVITSTRVIIFQWHPNSNLSVPTVNDILQTASLYSFYDWQYSNQFTILYDRIHFQAGISTAPASSGAQGYYGKVNLGRARKRSDFAAAVALGSEQFYCLVISDSTVAPFPLLTINSRVIYSDD